MINTNERFERARKMAIEAHGDQRYGDKPYAWHLGAVVAVLERFSASLEDETSALLIAARLHRAHSRRNRR